MLMGGEYERAKSQLITYFKLGGENTTPDYVVIPELFIKREVVFNGDALPNSIGIDPALLDEWVISNKALQERTIKPEDLSFPVLGGEKNAVITKGANTYENFSNVDTRLKGVIEVIIDAEYTLVNTDLIKELMLPEKPEILLDYIVLPVSLTLTSGETKQGFMFSSYPFSHEDPEDPVKLSRSINWDESFSDLDIARGMQLFSIGEKHCPIYELNTIEFVRDE